MDLATALQACPHLASPAALAVADTAGKFQLPPHLAVINRRLIDVPFTPNDRLAVNMPFQHGKTWLCSHYFPAWHLLLFPETRIILCAHSDRYAATFGSKVKDVIARFGGPHGVVLKEDTKAKDEWVIQDHGGGMVCRGPHGAVTGRPADLFLIDDLIKDAKDAMSVIVSDDHWDWYSTVAYSRLGPTASIVIVGTRWGPRDIFGRIAAEAARTGEKWDVVKFSAIATENDVIGRPPGAALWPERSPLKRLEMIRAERGRWFDTCWQQEPRSEAAKHFEPDSWPTYEDLGDAISIGPKGSRRVVLKANLYKFVTADWAASDKKHADYTAFASWGLFDDGSLALFDVFNERLKVEETVPAFALFCRRQTYRPVVAAVEAFGFQAALANECRRYPDIPEVRRIVPEGKANNKLRCALPAIVLAENGRLYLPAPPDDLDRVAGRRLDWLAGYKAQLAAFTGEDDEHDDMVDNTGFAAQLAQSLRGHRATLASSQYYGPCILTEGKEPF